jgi:flagellar motor switch protein FliN
MTRFQEVWIQSAAALLQETFGAGASFSATGSSGNLCDTIILGAEFTGLLQGRLIVKSAAASLDVCKQNWPASVAADWPLLFERITAEAVDILAAEHGLPLQFKTIPHPVLATSEGLAYALAIGDHSIPIFVIDETREMQVNRGSDAAQRPDNDAHEPQAGARGLDLLLDVELEASLRFGSREMPLSQVVELGPGDVVQLDRHISDPVDLVVGDKIVARGEVVLVNGNFGLRVTEVAEPRKRLENIRCLF